MTELTDTDVGKSVVNSDGEEIGRVVDIQNGRAFVDPDPSTAETVMSEFGWGDSDQGTYALSDESIATVTDEAVRLGPL